MVFGRSRAAVSWFSIIAPGCEFSEPFPGYGVPGVRADELRRDEDLGMEAVEWAGIARECLLRRPGDSGPKAGACLEAVDGGVGRSDRAGDVLRHQLAGWPGEWTDRLAPIGDH